MSSEHLVIISLQAEDNGSLRKAFEVLEEPNYGKGTAPHKIGTSAYKVFLSTRHSSEEVLWDLREAGVFVLAIQTEGGDVEFRHLKIDDYIYPKYIPRAAE